MVLSKPENSVMNMEYVALATFSALHVILMAY